jgi:two-component system NarL family response regulator
MAIRLLIVEHHPFFRKTLRNYLESAERFEIVGEASDSHEAVEAVEQLRPQIVIMDMNMPELGGISAGEVIKNKVPDLRLILYSIYSGDLYRNRAARRADACLAKDRLFDDLPDIVDRLCAKPF